MNRHPMIPLASLSRTAKMAEIRTPSLPSRRSNAEGGDGRAELRSGVTLMMASKKMIGQVTEKAGGKIAEVRALRQLVACNTPQKHRARDGDDLLTVGTNGPRGWHLDELLLAKLSGLAAEERANGGPTVKTTHISSGGEDVAGPRDQPMGRHQQQAVAPPTQVARDGGSHRRRVLARRKMRSRHGQRTILHQTGPAQMVLRTTTARRIPAELRRNRQMHRIWSCPRLVMKMTTMRRVQHRMSPRGL